jgi:hypothetical protein
MTEPKISSNNVEQAKAKQLEGIQIERQLIPRLKFMSLLLFFFSACSLGYSLIFAEQNDPNPPQDWLADELALVEEFQTGNIPLNLEGIELLNAYIIALSFAIVGSTCFLAAWSREKKLKKLLDTL